MTRTLLLLITVIFVVEYDAAARDKNPTPFSAAYYRTITIDHTKVPNTSQTNFPVLISGTFAYLKTVSNGGKVENANGHDILFSSDAAGSTLLNWEIEKYNPATGELIAWVKADLSPSTDKVIYIRYGDNSISSFQGGSAGTVWNSNFLGVYHCNDVVTNTGQVLKDFTSNAANFHSRVNWGSWGQTSNPITGYIGGGQEINPTGQGYDNSYRRAANFALTGAYTLEAWIKIPSTPSINHVIFGDTTGFHYTHFYNSQYRLDLSGSTKITSANTTSANTWYHLVITRNGTSLLSYENGVQTASSSNGGNLNVNAFGARGGDDGSSQMQYDEIRVSNTNRSADWIKTEYNNQSSPSTFYAIGNETGAGNQSPTANAGSDQSITLPTTQVSLTGTGSDADGTIASYAWTQISGTTATITNASSANTTITGLTTAGTRVFRLTVTDNSSATGTDDITITVNAAPPPTANAGSDQTITLPTNQVSLSGSGTANNGGSITGYAWTQISGTTVTITSASSANTTITGLTTAGTRVFRLTVTDNSNATGTDDVTITVNSASGVLPISEGGTGQSSFGAGYLQSNGTSLSSVATIPGSDISGTVGILNGGTGASTFSAALKNLLPSQSGNSGKVLQSDGENASWVAGGASKWTVSSGNNIYNTSLGNVGIGTNSPAYKLDVSGGVASFDPGPGATTIMRLRVGGNNHSFYSDANSELHYSGVLRVDQDLYPLGGINLQTYGAPIYLNSGPIIGASALTLPNPQSYIRLNNAYATGIFPEYQGIIVQYHSRASGLYPRAAFQAYNMEDPSEKPFVISSQGFGWLKNSKTDEPVWTLQAAASQTANVQEWKNSSGAAMTVVNASGSLGIGTSSPQASLHVAGSFRLVSGNQAAGKVLVSDANGNADWQTVSTGGSSQWTTATGNRIHYTGGSVGIGTDNFSSDYKLYVDGYIRTRKIKVDQASWADYVFEKSYQLPTLAEVEVFIQKNKRLPEMPSAAEIEKNGLNLGDNQVLLLKKIEELTLYIIEQNKKIEAQQTEINDLKSANKKIDELGNEIKIIKAVFLKSN